MTYAQRVALEQALILAERLHAGQVDKAGQPYVGHLRRVAEILLARFPDCTPSAVEAAVLHDTLEDTGADPAALRLAGVSEQAIRLVLALTKPTNGCDYLAWIQSISGSGDLEAIKVKLADISDNSSPDRVHTDMDRLLRTKYGPAQTILERALVADMASYPDTGRPARPPED